MGCAASSSAQTTTTRVVYPTQKPIHGVHVAYGGYSTQHNQVTTTIVNKSVVVKNVPEAPKSHSRKSSSSSSSSGSVDLDEQRRKIKEQSAAAAAVRNKEVKLSIDTLNQYNALSLVIAQLERKNVVQLLEEKMRLSIDLKNQASQMNNEYKQLQIKTHKELRDVQNLESLASADTVMSYFKDQVSFDTQMSKEQEEYIQVKTEMEDCYKRLLALQTRQSKIESEVKELQNDRDELNKHYKEQDDILDSIFNGAYGSDLEDQLEGDLDKQLDRKQRIEVAMQRWKNAEIMANSAHRQLSHAFNRWQDILRVPANNPGHKMLRYQIAGEVRSYLVAASQNLTGINRTLHNVKLPYCDMSEIATLNKAIAYIFTDVYERSRHSHAGNVYKITRDRCFVLGQWITHVITGAIQQDLNNSRNVCKDLQTKLRAERSKLMKEKIEEETGEKVNWEEAPTDSGIDTDVESDTSGVAAEAEKIPEAQDLDQQIKDAQEEDVPDGGDGGEGEEAKKPTAVPLDELAPAPKQDELFGNLEVVMAEYDKQREEYAREMEANRARQQADFQMKLKSRRSRQRRMMAQEQELNELIQKEKDAATIEVPNKDA